MAVRKLDLATRKEMLSRISQEKRAPKKEMQKKGPEEDKRWKPLVMATASTSPYLCHCRDVKRGYANICPAHMLAFSLSESVH